MKRIKVILLFFCYMQIALAQGGPGGDPSMDINFIKAIKDFRPSVLDLNDRIIPERADTVTGDFNCSGRSIQSLEGIQFFPRLRSINARNNNIMGVPTFFGPKIIEWQSLDLDSNQLGYLQPLNGVIRLKKLNVSHNQLGGIGSLDGQPELEEFNCADNNLSSLAYNLFDKNRNLKQLDVSNNKLQKLPNLGNNRELETLNISNNTMVRVPDLSNLPNLKYFDLVGASFTFGDLYPFSSTFVLPPIRKLNRGGDTTILENQTLILRTRVDKDVPGTSYTWYKGNVSMGTVTNDAFTLSNVQINQAGNYYCKITHIKVPQCTLVTDTFRVRVNTCLDISSAKPTIVTGINCQQNGSVQIKMNAPPGQSLTYTLKSSLSTFTNKDGLFKGLSEPSYQLTIANGPNCQKLYPDPILIPTQECLEAFMTLDNDGEKDTYYFAQQGPIKIYDTNGNLIKSLTAPAHWDGSSKSASRVAPGYYLADVNNGEAMVKITVVY